MRKTVAIAGASGLVGSHLLHGLLEDVEIEHVYALCRKPLPLNHPKLTWMEVDFEALPLLPAIDEVYLALGTTIKVAGSQEAFSKVDFSYNLAVAKAALTAGAQKIALVSSIGANAHSSTFYTRVKGALEEALIALKPQGLVIARPSILLGDRTALHQPARKGEFFSIALAKLLNPFMPLSWRAIEAKNVANALRIEAPKTMGVLIINSARLHQYP